MKTKINSFFEEKNVLLASIYPLLLKTLITSNIVTHKKPSDVLDRKKDERGGREITFFGEGRKEKMRSRQNGSDIDRRVNDISDDFPL